VVVAVELVLGAPVASDQEVLRDEVTFDGGGVHAGVASVLEDYLNRLARPLVQERVGGGGLLAGGTVGDEAGGGEGGGEGGGGVGGSGRRVWRRGCLVQRRVSSGGRVLTWLAIRCWRAR